MTKECPCPPSKERPDFRLSKSHVSEITLAFLLRIIEEGGCTISGEQRNRREGEDRAREQNLIGAYYCSEATLEDLGKIYGEKNGEPITRERIRQVIEKGMRRLWENSSKETKEMFPWESLSLGKLIKERKKSETTKKVIQEILAGKSFDEIKEKGINPEQLHRAREILLKSGFDGELLYQGLTGEAKRKFINRLESAEIPQQVRAIFDEVKNTHVERRLSTLSLVKLGDVIASCGFQETKLRGDRNVFIASLEEAGVVVGYTEHCLAHGPHTGRIKRYYFIRSKDFVRAKETLHNDATLARLRE